MLANREDEMWSLTPHEQRGYTSETERSFFETIENAPSPTAELRDVYHTYGKFLVD